MSKTRSSLYLLALVDLSLFFYFFSYLIFGIDITWIIWRKWLIRWSPQTQILFFNLSFMDANKSMLSRESKRVSFGPPPPSNTWQGSSWYHFLSVFEKTFFFLWKWILYCLKRKNNFDYWKYFIRWFINVSILGYIKNWHPCVFILEE